MLGRIKPIWKRRGEIPDKSSEKSRRRYLGGARELNKKNKDQEDAKKN